MNKNIYKEDKLDLFGKRKRRKKAEILELLKKKEINKEVKKEIKIDQDNGK